VNDLSQRYHDAPAPPQRTLLLVDDEPTVRSALRRFFVRRGWVVDEAEDGERARSVLLDGAVIGGNFDVILTDIRMPRLSGMALYDAVTRVDPTMHERFIFSSGDLYDDESTLFLGRTQCPVAQKPFDLASLLAMVESIAAPDSARS
jgi:DNA-binding NtrC family response regulator